MRETPATLAATAFHAVSLPAVVVTATAAAAVAYALLRDGRYTWKKPSSSIRSSPPILPQ